MILLTEREINKVTLQYARGTTYYHGAANAALIRAQLKKVAEWLEDFIVFEGNCDVDLVIRDHYWQDLKKEAGI